MQCQLDVCCLRMATSPPHGLTKDEDPEILAALKDDDCRRKENIPQDATQSTDFQDTSRKDFSKKISCLRFSWLHFIWHGEDSTIFWNTVASACGFFSTGYQLGMPSLQTLLLFESYGSSFTSFFQSSVNSSTLYGILLGQLFFGFLADMIGRKNGLLLTTICIAMGAIISTSSNGTSTPGIFWMDIVGRALSGFGVGGEYSCAVPNIAEDSEQVAFVHRGRRVSLLVNLLEAIGIAFPPIISYIMLGIFGSNKYEVSWRFTYAFAIIPAIIVFILRTRMRNSRLYRENRKTSISKKRFLIILKVYGFRFVGAALNWFLLKWINNGQLAYQGVIFSQITGSSVVKTAWVSIVQNVSTFPAPIVAAWCLDYFGRKKTLSFGWFLLALSSFLLGGFYIDLSRHTAGFAVVATVPLFVEYFIFNPLYVIPTEIFPTSIRGRMTGLTTAFGTAGGIAGTEAYIRLKQSFGGGTSGLRTIQYLNGGLSMLGLVVALALIPERSGCSLTEEDRTYNISIGISQGDSSNVRDEDNELAMVPVANE